MTFARACQFDVVQVERVGDEDVVLVIAGERIEYHRFTGRAFDVWQLLDGATAVDAIADRVFPEAGDDGVALVWVALDELERAGLLEPEGVPHGRYGRRHVAKLAVAAAIGSIGLPAVVSMTAPSSASAETIILPIYSSCGSQMSGVCASELCCCQTGSIGSGTCLDPTVCTEHEFLCING